MAHYQKFFEDADADGSGFLTEDELVGALRKNGYSGDDDTIKVPPYCIPVIETSFQFLDRDKRCVCVCVCVRANICLEYTPDNLSAFLPEAWSWIPVVGRPAPTLLEALLAGL